MLVRMPSHRTAERRQFERIAEIRSGRQLCRAASIFDQQRTVCARGVGVVAGTEYCIAKWQPQRQSHTQANEFKCVQH